MRWIALVFFTVLSGCASQPNSKAPVTDAPKPRAGNATVVWISIDGFRHDYLARIAPPTLSRLAREGAYTTQQRPIFPSLTFPNHIAQVTGTGVDRHGIVLN